MNKHTHTHTHTQEGAVGIWHKHTHTQEETVLRALWVTLVEKGICTQRFLLKCADDLGMVVPGANLTRMQLEGMRMLRQHPSIQEKILKIDLPNEVILAQIQVSFCCVCTHDKHLYVCLCVHVYIIYIYIYIYIYTHTHTHAYIDL
jgi:hypothetical protein